MGPRGGEGRGGACGIGPRGGEGREHEAWGRGGMGLPGRKSSASLCEWGSQQNLSVAVHGCGQNSPCPRRASEVVGEDQSALYASVIPLT